MDLVNITKPKIGITLVIIVNLNSFNFLHHKILTLLFAKMIISFLLIRHAFLSISLFQFILITYSNTNISVMIL